MAYKDHPELPTKVLIVFSLILPWFLVLAVTVGIEAWNDWRKIEVQGVVVDTRVVFDDKPYTKNVGRWCKEWLVEYGDHRQWFRVTRYHSESEVQTAGDMGKTKRVWYTPDDDAVDTEPTPLSKTLATAWLAMMGAMGLVSIYALVLRIMMRGD